MNETFHLIDRTKWERDIYFDYYYNRIKCRYTLNAMVDITELAAYRKHRGLKFFPTMLYAIMRVVNSNREFRMVSTVTTSWDIGKKLFRAIRYSTMRPRRLPMCGASMTEISRRFTTRFCGIWKRMEIERESLKLVPVSPAIFVPCLACRG